MYYLVYIKPVDNFIIFTMDSLNIFIIKLKNGLKKNHKSIQINYSSVIVDILNILEFEGYIQGYKIIKNKISNSRNIIVFLKYYQNKAVIRIIKKISKKSRQIFVKKSYLLFSNKEGATYIISTPKGILSDKEALKLNVGGEVLLKIC